MYHILVTALVGGTPIHQHVRPERYPTEMACREAIPDVATGPQYVPPVGAAYGFACVKIDERA